jgi:hypothetical protein
MVVITGGWELLLASSEYKLDILLNSILYAEHPIMYNMGFSC